MSSDTDALVDALSDGEYEYVSVGVLHPHPENSEVYGEIDPGESFIEDIRRNGVETPLIVNDHPDTEAEWDLPNTVIGGHRRLEAARRVGLAAVPVKWESYPEPLATRRLILNNLQREKNDAQLAREMLMLEDTARREARKDQSAAGGKNPGSLRPNSAEAGGSGRWRERVADDVGVGHDKVRYTTDVFRFADPDEYVHEDFQKPEKYDVDAEVRELAREKIEQMEAGEETAHSAYQDIKNKMARLEDEQRREEQRESFREQVAESGAATVHHGDFVEVLSEYDDGSLDHIITDPPYDEDALSLWSDLAAVAADKLTDGGYLVAYSGQSYLPQVYNTLTDELEYIWQLVVTHESAGKHPYHSIGIGHKPVLLFGKETSGYRDSLISRDVIDIGDQEKDDHEWQQSVIEAEQLIEWVTEPNDLICDPMCGSGTTGVAALRKERRTLLVDVDEDAAMTTRRKIAEVLDTDD
jgi:site-specific DNA-methyltransferase (adenine-specific)